MQEWAAENWWYIDILKLVLVSIALLVAISAPVGGMLIRDMKRLR